MKIPFAPFVSAVAISIRAYKLAMSGHLADVGVSHALDFGTTPKGSTLDREGARRRVRFADGATLSGS